MQRKMAAYKEINLEITKPRTGMKARVYNLLSKGGREIFLLTLQNALYPATLYTSGYLLHKNWNFDPRYLRSLTIALYIHRVFDENSLLDYMDSINITDFGVTKRGEKVQSIILKPNISDQDGGKVGKFEVEILTYGATVRSILLGLGAESIDVALGCNNIRDYENSQIYMGCVVGRVANRIKSLYNLLRVTFYKDNREIR
uniref:Galactose mutarotase n=1 Tax=Romanomermis culicivorax TaxID=13658 RepID=A0A915IAG7_ROMCU